MTTEQQDRDRKVAEASLSDDALVCPDCGMRYEDMESANCAQGHPEILLDWWPVCQCGHKSHYDMTTFCLDEDCNCDKYQASDQRVQITRRHIS